MIRRGFSHRVARVIGLSFYCITLAVFCQVKIPRASALNNSTPVDNFYFQDFTADYYLSQAEDGASRLKVVERLIAVFPDSNQNHGLTRIIPYTNQDGKNLTLPSDSKLEIQLKHNGIPEKPYKIESGDGYFTVYLGDPDEYVHGRQIYELEYEFRNVITAPPDNPDHQELYWDTNGNDWPQSFDSVTARVHFVGDTVKSGYDGQDSCYVGAYGASNPCVMKPLDDGVEFHAYDLKARENLTFALEFAPQTFRIPDTTYDYRVVYAVVVELGVAVALIATILTIRHQTKAKREYYAGLFLTPEYTPPRGFTVAEMAANYIGPKILSSSKVATLLELAVTHKVELIKSGSEHKPQWIVKVLSTSLSAEQTKLLKLLAGSDKKLSQGQEIMLKRHQASTSLQQISRKYDQVITDHLYAMQLYESKTPKSGKQPARRKTNLCDILFTCGVFWIMGAIIIAPWVLADIPSYVVLYGGWPLIALMFVLAITIAITALGAGNYYQKFYTHTETGLKWSRYLDGLYLYLKMAEQERLKFLQSVKGVDTSNQGVVKLYEKLLPYAAIFRLETSWLQTLSKYYEMADVNAPAWYIGSTVFSANDFTHALHAISSSASAVDSIAHSGSSGSSSGFSGSTGGGFSGGGGGGGGGGGW